jgi:two-component system response regulator NreC
MEVVAEASNGVELLRYLDAVEADVVLVDLDMPQKDGFGVIEDLSGKAGSPKTILLTMHNEKGIIRKALDLGASGFLLKTTDKDELLNAIRKVHKGGQAFSADVTMTLLSPNNDQSKKTGNSGINDIELTDREIEILTLIAQGKSNKEIGEELFISHRTVDTHRTNMMKKLEVHNLAGLIRIAFERGLV